MVTASRFLSNILACVGVAQNEGMSCAPKQLEVVNTTEGIQTARVLVLVDGRCYRVSVEEITST